MSTIRELNSGELDSVGGGLSVGVGAHVGGIGSLLGSVGNLAGGALSGVTALSAGSSAE